MKQRLLKFFPVKKLEKDIRRQIESGVLRPDDRIRSESDLAACYRISLYEVRKVLRRLRKAGCLYSKPRSGNHVAKRSCLPVESGSPRNEGPAGFHVFDVIDSALCGLKFVITGWNRWNKPIWEKICRAFGEQNRQLSIEPYFPLDKNEFIRQRADCDIYITSSSELTRLIDVPFAVERISESDMSALPLGQRYKKAVAIDGAYAGVPLTGTLLVGTLNSDVMSRREAEALAAAPCWEVFLSRLAEVRADHSGFHGINLGHYFSMTLLQYLSIQCGEWFESRTTLAKRWKDMAKALGLVEQYRCLFVPPPDQMSAALSRQYLAYFNWTYTLVNNPDWMQFKPWLFPRGRNGSYLAALNVGVISGRTRYPEECRKFLQYLLSDRVQNRFACIVGEHPVSEHVANPFLGYHKTWQCVLKEIKRESQIYRRLIPGLHNYLDQVYDPPARRFMNGEIAAPLLLNEIKPEAHRLFQRVTKKQSPCGYLFPQYKAGPRNAL